MDAGQKDWLNKFSIFQFTSLFQLERGTSLLDCSILSCACVQWHCFCLVYHELSISIASSWRPSLVPSIFVKLLYHNFLISCVYLLLITSWFWFTFIFYEKKKKKNFICCYLTWDCIVSSVPEQIIFLNLELFEIQLFFNISVNLSMEIFTIATRIHLFEIRKPLSLVLYI